jgi:aminoglycoside phosphotransferase (APT) family kinase protein
MTLPHGYGLDDDLHQRLRGAPPDTALRWVENSLGARVLTAEPMEGGNSSAVHRLTLSGWTSAVIMRRYVLEWTADEPEIPVNEALVLDLLSSSPSVLAPRLLAADPLGTDAGVPTTVMSALTGSVVWDPPAVAPWLAALVDLAERIHALPVSASLSSWRPYEPELVPPAWTRHQRAWELALEAYYGPRPEMDRVFLHRDFHPGNVLWTDGVITGVVDWVSACAGPPEEDIAHCRVNLARHHGLATADRFLRMWLDATGRSSYDPYHDLVNVVSMVDETPDERLDEFVASAAAQLSGDHM